MKKFIILILPFALILSAFFPLISQAMSNSRNQFNLENQKIFVEVNPTVELINIVFSFTNKSEIEEKFGISPIKLNSKYAEDINEWFSPYKNHKAIKLAQKLVEHLFVCDAPVSFAIYFSDPPDLKKKCKYSKEFLESRGVEKATLDEFADILRDFSRETNFIEFYDSHKEFYEEIIQEAEKRIELEDIVKTVEDFFGKERKEYHLVLMPSSLFGGGFGPHLPTGEIYCLISPFPPTGQEPQMISYLTNKMAYYLVLHEFSHPFINPVVEKYASEFEKYSYLIDPYLKRFGQIIVDNESIPAAPYQSWGFFSELLDRASNAYIAKQKGDWIFARGILGVGAEAQGFYFIKDAYKLYGVYEANRDKYPNFESFLPIILEELDKIEQSKEINMGEIAIIIASIIVACLETIWLIKKKVIK
jgi:hypothetical protein